MFYFGRRPRCEAEEAFCRARTAGVTWAGGLSVPLESDSAGPTPKLFVEVVVMTS